MRNQRAQFQATFAAPCRGGSLLLWIQKYGLQLPQVYSIIFRAKLPHEVYRVLPTRDSFTVCSEIYQLSLLAGEICPLTIAFGRQTPALRRIERCGVGRPGRSHSWGCCFRCCCRRQRFRHSRPKSSPASCRCRHCCIRLVLWFFQRRPIQMAPTQTRQPVPTLGN